MRRLDKCPYNILSFVLLSDFREKIKIFSQEKEELHKKITGFSKKKNFCIFLLFLDLLEEIDKRNKNIDELEFELSLLNEEKNTNIQANLIRELKLDLAKTEIEVENSAQFYIIYVNKAII